MVKTVLMRPHAVALCAFQFQAQAHFFSSRALLPCLPATKRLFCNLTPLRRRVSMLPEKISGTKRSGCDGYGSKLEIRRSLSIIRATTTQVNDSGSIDSPLIQSMENKEVEPMLRGLKYEYQVQMCVQAVDSHEFDLIVGERVSFKSSVKNSGVGFVQRNHYGGVMDCNSAIRGGRNTEVLEVLSSGAGYGGAKKMGT
ncbi:hypothetical protein TEA_029021 [Camellia sinensis var. sinensis]|uniref:Uncharacterized protein n=1 Tax=Camellia sinensis var. sinensis TaxID=542762 RepID=A0A4V3WP78_CAMSN|nr:hypothetical protein TEA_029021 [Camellia sinensis var. sinensis]